MQWRDAHRAAMMAAADAHEKLSLDTFHRIDVLAAMCTAGLKVIFRELDCAALYLPASLGDRPGAIINASHPLALQRYSAGHEVGHHFFGHETQVIRDAEPRSGSSRLNAQEMLAEAFAAWFLMPPEGVEQTLRSMGLTAPRSPEDVYALALRLGTSYQATCVHLTSLKLLSSARSTEWSKLPLKTVKQTLSDTPPPGGWRNDVWVLSLEDSALPVVPRRGDRVLFEVPGCEVRSLPAGVSAERVPAADLLSRDRLQVDVPVTMDAGPASILLEHDGVLSEFALAIERPRKGRYLPPRSVPA
jgi:Zn-dependent peptidase ImmA (M78 family)